MVRRRCSSDFAGIQCKNMFRVRRGSPLTECRHCFLYNHHHPRPIASRVRVIRKKRIKNASKNQQQKPRKNIAISQ